MRGPQVWSRFLSQGWGGLLLPILTGPGRGGAHDSAPGNPGRARCRGDQSRSATRLQSPLRTGGAWFSAR
eukprot:6883844-Pyramimonas_sp.AAC.1